MPRSHLTTREAAKVLELPYKEALAVLKAGSVENARMGAGFLWARDDVRRVRDALRSGCAGEATGGERDG